MADEKIANDQHVILIDNFPGAALTAMKMPEDGFTGTTHHNVATVVYPVGTKIQVYCPGSAVVGTKSGAAGYATFIYLKLEAVDSTNTCGAAKQIVGIHTDAVPYDVTNEAATAVGAGKTPIAVTISAMTENYYGWFWCGGVCPVDYVDALDGAYCTDNSVAIGPMTWGALASPSSTVGEFGFSLPAADTAAIIGYTLKADEAL